MASELPGWEIIRKILDNHPKRAHEDGVLMNYINPAKSDFKEVISSKKTIINCEQMDYVYEE